MSYFIEDSGNGEPSPESSPEPVVAVLRTGSVVAGLYPGPLPSAFPEAYDAGSLNTEPVVADSGYPAPDGSAASGISSSCNPSGSQDALQPIDATQAPAASVLDVCDDTNIVVSDLSEPSPSFLGSLDAVVVAEAIGIGEMVSYYSTTHGGWIPAHVVGHNFIDGVLKSYDLNIKKRAFPYRIDVGDGRLALSAPPPESTAATSSSDSPLIAGSAAVADVGHLNPVAMAGEPPSHDGPDSREPAVHDATAMLEVGQPALSMPPQEGTAAASSSDSPLIAGSAAVADVGHLNPVAVAGEPLSHDGPDDALSAVSWSESAESVVDIGPHFDTDSIASTEAPGVRLHHVRHGRRAPQPTRRFPPPCHCSCASTPAQALGPRSRLTRRCNCPMCGHRSVEQGHGCHIRMEIPLDFTGLVICPHCDDFCMAFLRWGDIFYANGAVWPQCRDP